MLYVRLVFLLVSVAYFRDDLGNKKIQILGSLHCKWRENLKARKLPRPKIDFCGSGSPALAKERRVKMARMQMQTWQLHVGKLNGFLRPCFGATSWYQIPCRMPRHFQGTVVRTVSMLASWIPNVQALPDNRIAIALTWIFMILGQQSTPISCLLTVALGLGIAVPAFQTSCPAL